MRGSPRLRFTACRQREWLVGAGCVGQLLILGVLTYFPDLVLLLPKIFYPDYF